MPERPSYKELEDTVCALEQTVAHLKASKEGYEQIIDHLDEVLYKLDRDGKITYISPNIESVTGYRPAEIVGRSYIAFLSPDDPKTPGIIFGKILEGEKLATEHLFVTKNGGTVWATTKARPIFEQDRVVGVQGALVDITEQKRTEAELRTNQAFLSSIFNSIQDGISILDQDLTIQYTNPVMEAWYAENMPLVGKKCYRCYHNSDAPCNPCPTLRCLESGQTEFDYIPGLPGSAVEWIELFSYPMKDSETGRITGVIEFVRDITEQMNMEKALREREERLNLALSGTNTGLWDWNVQTGETVFNEKWAEILGYTLAELAPVSIRTWMDLCHPADLEVSNQLLEAYFSGETDFYECEARMRHKDGSWVWILDRGKVVEWDPDGRPLRMIGTHTDITQRKKDAEEREEMNARLQQAGKTEALGRMAGSVAHHFNNRIGAILGNLELAMEHLQKESPARKHLTEAVSTCRLTSQITAQMLTYLGQSRSGKELLDLSEMCRRHLPKVQVTIPWWIELEVRLQEPGPWVYADAEDLKQALTGLIVNAYEAIGGNPGRILLRTGLITAEELGHQHLYPVDWQPADAPYACLSVADTGCGVSRENLEKIFDPFFSTKFTGRGLGLPVVLGMARSNSGGIGVESLVGQGTTIRVLFPLQESTPRSGDRQTTGKGNDAACGSVLLVEDQKEVRQTAITMIQHLGYAVIDAADGHEAISVFRKRGDEIGCVITDLSMPGMDGWKTIEALREICPGIPVILVSGYEEATKENPGCAQPPDAFLCKPYQLADLKAALTKIYAG